VSTTLRTATGDLAIPRTIITDPGAVAVQTLIDTFALWQGAYFLDQAAGFPWAQAVVGQMNPSVPYIEALLKDAILGVPGVVSVTASATFNRRTRAFSYSFTATLDTGVVVAGGSHTPFYVVSQGG
jgi:hypothetical protein